MDIKPNGSAPVAPDAGGLFHRHGLAGPDHRGAGRRRASAPPGCASNLAHAPPGTSIRSARPSTSPPASAAFRPGADRSSEVRAGDTVWFAPGEKHWHGAAPDMAMTHLAMQEALDGTHVTWMEKVADEQYGGKVEG